MRAILPLPDWLGNSAMRSTLHPLPKLVICIVWILASILVFDLGFQLFAIALAVGVLIVLERRSLFLVLALMVPFALFGFVFFKTSVPFRQDSHFALQTVAETLFGAPAVSGPGQTCSAAPSPAVWSRPSSR